MTRNSTRMALKCLLNTIVRQGQYRSLRAKTSVKEEIWEGKADFLRGERLFLIPKQKKQWEERKVMDIFELTF